MQSQHEILMQDLEFRREFVIERFVGECTEVISRIMHEKGISKSVLSRRLGKSRAWVTQLLSGSRNMTARTLAEVAFALDVELRLQSSLPAANLDQGEWHELGSSTMERGRGGSKPRVIEFRLASQVSDAGWRASVKLGRTEEFEMESPRLIA